MVVVDDWLVVVVVVVVVEVVGRGGASQPHSPVEEWNGQSRRPSIHQSSYHLVNQSIIQSVI